MQRAEMDVNWIGSDLARLADRVRNLEADLGDLMAQDVEHKATKGQAKQAEPPNGGEIKRAADASQDRRGPPCSVCVDPRRDEIERALVSGQPDTRVSASFRELSADAIRRHREAHLPARLLKAREVAEVAQADALLEQVRTLHRRALAILDASESAGDLRTALGGIREARGCLELLGRLEGELEPPTVNLIVSPAFIELRSRLLRALEPFEEARRAVAAALIDAG